ncbi:hypothetical protein PQX77_008784 [Marasmius sp. AFHP31]|nr:hypothetical protein PQX77_008784 [Marasmius sp. AFHP31]
MKYPLAIVKQLLKDFGRELGIGYDIMCAFYTTMLRSHKLGQKVVSYAVQGVVPAFHGHAHNRKCQTCWHPQYLTGVGLTDFEDCERMFSQSNHLASTTRLATPFHRRQAIVEHFGFQDEDKHASSGNFLYENYWQAQNRIDRDGPQFATMAQMLKLTAGECENLLEMEKKHLCETLEEAPELKQNLDYLELFEKVNWAKGESNEAHLKYKALNGRKDLSSVQVNKIKARNISTFKRYERLAETLEDYVMEHGIQRWTIGSPEYRQAQDGLKERGYQRALEELEKLVVQRLFELTKLNMSGVCYKQREQIGKALRTRAEAIRNAIDRYNKAALPVGRPTVTWAKIVEMANVADFDLLKNTHVDIGNLIWTKPEYREAMRLHFGLLRAREEKIRCNVEITRLITYMLDEHADYQLATHRLQEDDRNLVAELNRQARYREAVHSRIAERLALTSRLAGFTGTLLPGRREGREPSLTASVALPSWATEVLGIRQNLDGSYACLPATLKESESSQRAHQEYRQRDDNPSGLVKFMERMGMKDDR